MDGNRGKHEKRGKGELAASEVSVVGCQACRAFQNSSKVDK